MSEASPQNIFPAGERAGRPPLRYAVIFRTHFWDDFTRRQLERLQMRAGSGDVYVLVDETRGSVPGITAEKVFRLTDNEILDAGYVSAGEGSIQWFSGDVPLYMFQKAYPGYHYYVQMEYDVAVHLNLDDLVGKVRDDEVDLVAVTNAETLDTWHWLPSCLEVYGREQIKHQLICFSIYSAGALARLSQARLDQAARFRSGEINAWPYCEGFIATEASLQQLRLAELSDYGDVSAYVWWPPYIESELPSLQKHAFVHPVLDADKYVPSLLKNDAGIRPLIDPSSWFHRKLRKLGLAGYVRVLTSKGYLQTVSRSARKWLAARQAG